MASALEYLERTEDANGNKIVPVIKVVPDHNNQPRLFYIKSHERDADETHSQ